MYLGRYRLGDVVPVPVFVRSTGDVLTAPSAAPLLAVYDGSGTRVLHWCGMPCTDPAGAVGSFVYKLRLGSAFAVGHYSAIASALRPGAGLSWCSFEILAGGDVDGAVIAARYYQRPHADFIVGRLDSDQRLLAKQPREAL